MRSVTSQISNLRANNVLDLYRISPKTRNMRSTPIKDQGCLHSDTSDKENILNIQYSVFTREQTDELSIPELERSSTIPDIVVTTECLVKLLRKINIQKASGPDQLPARNLKELADNFALYLYMIYQKSLFTWT